MIRSLSRLTRLPLSLMNGAAALAGCSLSAAPRSATALTAAFTGVTLLAMAAAALNQVLERDIDALMTRTRLRPLPQGELTPAAAALIGGVLCLAGCGVLSAAGGPLAALLGLAALAWYLAVYTPLKRITPLALPLGALCGAVPPLIGWCLAGGAPSDYRIITLAGLFFIWQVPHFWLLQERHAEDYRRAGIPLFAIRPGHFGLWVVALAASALMLPAFGIIGRTAASWYVLSLSILLVMGAWWRKGSPVPYLNMFPLLVAVTMSIR